MSKLRKLKFLSPVFTLVTFIMNIVGYSNYINFNYEINGYYVFQKGIDQTQINLENCKKFDIESLYEFQALTGDYDFFIINIPFRVYVSIEFFLDLILLIFLEGIYINKLCKNENEEKFDFKDFFNLVFKLLFLPGTFFVTKLDYSSGCLNSYLPNIMYTFIRICHYINPFVYGTLLIFLIANYLKKANKDCTKNNCATKSLSGIFSILLTIIKCIAFFLLILFLFYSVLLYVASYYCTVISITTTVLITLNMTIIIKFDFCCCCKK